MSLLKIERPPSLPAGCAADAGIDVLEPVRAAFPAADGGGTLRPVRSIADSSPGGDQGARDSRPGHRGAGQRSDRVSKCVGAFEEFH